MKTRAESRWWEWYTSGEAPASLTEEDAEMRCAAWVAGDSDDGPEDHPECHACRGTGIGQNGDPDTAKCHVCGGRGYVVDDSDDCYGDYLYDSAKDDALERAR
jgi:DnaJ-class molecular chaperone